MAILLSPNTKEERSRQDDSNSEIQKELTSSLNNLESLIPENFENLNLFRCSCTNPTIRMNRFTSDIESNCRLSRSISVVSEPAQMESAEALLIEGCQEPIELMIFSLIPERAIFNQN